MRNQFGQRDLHLLPASHGAYGLRREAQRHAAFLGVFGNQTVFKGKLMIPVSIVAAGK